MWSFIMSLHIKKSVTYPDYKCDKRQKIIYAILGWGIPFLFSLVPIFVSGTDGYEWISESHCWISTKYQYLRFILLFIPLWIVVCFNLYQYCKLKYKIKGLLHSIEEKASFQDMSRGTLTNMYRKYVTKRKNSNIEINTTKDSKKILENSKLEGLSKEKVLQMHSTFSALNLYPIIQAVSWSGITVARLISEVAPGDKIPLWFLHISIILVVASPILNAIVFFSYPSVRAKLKECCWNEKHVLKEDNINRENIVETDLGKDFHGMRQSVYEEDFDDDDLGVMDDDYDETFSEYYGNDKDLFDKVLQKHGILKSDRKNIEMVEGISMNNPLPNDPYV